MTTPARPNVDRAFLATFARSTVDAAIARTPSPTMRPGTVVASEEGVTTVLLDGDDAPVLAQALTPEPAEGDRVMVHLVPPSGAFVAGFIGDSRTRWGTGGGGGTTGEVAFTFTQGTPLATWVIDHPLPFPPNVVAVDSTGRQIEGDVSYGAGQVVVKFSAAISGSAYLS